MEDAVYLENNVDLYRVLGSEDVEKDIVAACQAKPAKIYFIELLTEFLIQ